MRQSPREAEDPRPKYTFQSLSLISRRRVHDHRPRAEALSQAQVLLKRLGKCNEPLAAKLLGDTPDPCSTPAVRQTLFRWASDVPVTITWYEERLRWSRKLQGFGVVAVLVVALAALVWTASPKSLPGEYLRSPSVGSASVGLVVAFLMSVLQLLALLTDRRARIGAFWKASADLQERLFTFEERWLDKPVLERVDDHHDRVSAEFLVGLVEEIAKARLVAREERATFFATLISPSELLSAASQGLSTVRARRADLDEAQKQEAKLLKARADEATTEQARLAAAVAELAAKRDELAGLAAAPPEERAQAEIDAESARLECERIRNRLASLLAGHADVA